MYPPDRDTGATTLFGCFTGFTTGGGPAGFIDSTAPDVCVGGGVKTGAGRETCTGAATIGTIGLVL